ncbi:MAG: transglutaminase domain-containing protein, partial [Bacteroidetes bacterium]|nr:transglutaminase domain-containing protein [Bacteroidota bacterium]
MRLTGLLLMIACAAIVTSCRNRQTLISNQQRLDDIDRMLKVQKELTKNSKTDIWSIFDDNLKDDEQQAMQFVYAYMPLSDLADYSSSFFLANVKRSLEAREATAWGSTLPEDVFLHFVLPLRVNNENLDSFRLVMYPEIMERIKGMNMKEAALEINHWCHEKVNYRGTDSRTSAPLSTIKKSFGRC